MAEIKCGKCQSSNKSKKYSNWDAAKEVYYVPECTKCGEATVVFTNLRTLEQTTKTGENATKYFLSKSRQMLIQDNDIEDGGKKEDFTYSEPTASETRASIKKLNGEIIGEFNAPVMRTLNNCCTPSMSEQSMFQRETLSIKDQIAYRRCYSPQNEDEKTLLERVNKAKENYYRINLL